MESLYCIKSLCLWRVLIKRVCVCVWAGVKEGRVNHLFNIRMVWFNQCETRLIFHLSHHTSHLWRVCLWPYGDTGSPCVLWVEACVLWCVNHVNKAWCTLCGGMMTVRVGVCFICGNKMFNHFCFISLEFILSHVSCSLGFRCIHPFRSLKNSSFDLLLFCVLLVFYWVRFLRKSRSNLKDLMFYNSNLYHPLIFSNHLITKYVAWLFFF